MKGERMEYLVSGTEDVLEIDLTTTTNNHNLYSGPGGAKSPCPNRVNYSPCPPALFMYIWFG